MREDLKISALRRKYPHAMLDLISSYIQQPSNLLDCVLQAKLSFHSVAVTSLCGNWYIMATPKPLTLYEAVLQRLWFRADGFYS